MVFQQRVKSLSLYVRYGGIFLQHEIWLEYILELHWVMWSFENIYTEQKKRIYILITTIS